MNAIRDIIVKGFIFAVLSTVFCMGGIPAAPLVSTAHAGTPITEDTTSWSGEMTLTGSDDVTISTNVILSSDTKFTVEDGLELEFKKGIDCNDHTLTIEGPGTVAVAVNETGDSSGINGNVILNGGTLTASGGSGEMAGGIGINGTVILNDGILMAIGGEGTKSGGDGIYGNVTQNGGELTVFGGGKFYLDGAGGTGISGDVELNGGILTVTGGDGNTPGAAFGGNVTIASDKCYTDYTRIFTWILSDREKSYISGKTLRPCSNDTKAVVKTAADETLYSNLQEAINAATGGGTVTLLNDVEINNSDQLLTVNGNLTLDLNDNYIYYRSQSQRRVYRSLISIEAGGNLCLEDNAADKTTRYLVLEDHSIRGSKPDDMEGLDYITTTGGLIVGGNCIENPENPGRDLNGGGVTVYEGGTFTMSEGTICGNSSGSFGGGVYVDGGTFTMKNGTICGNLAFYSGGGVYVDGGTFTMENGRICNNTARTGLGGGVHVGSGTFTMVNGTFCNNMAECDNGGGVSVSDGTFTMENGTISGNTARADGGGVFVHLKNAIFTMTGGKINNNTSGGFGGGVFVRKGTFNMTGGKIKDNTRKEYGNDITQNVYLDDGKTITISGNLAETTSIGITTGIAPTADSPVRVTSGWKTNMSAKDPSPYLMSDDTEYALLLNDGEIELRKAYKATVNNGDGTGSYAVGASVAIKAKAPASGKRFKEWKGVDDLTFTVGNKKTSEATFTMPAQAVTVEATYEDIPTVSVPKFSPKGGTYTSAQNITISSETSGADIYYTLDGSTPTASSAKYSEPVSVMKTMTIKAIAVKADMLDSDVISATYTINSVTPAKTYAVTVENGSGDGSYAAGATVTIKADALTAGKVFDRWTTGDGVAFADAASETTTFEMPAKAVTVKATYRDVNTVAAPVFMEYTIG